MTSVPRLTALLAALAACWFVSGSTFRAGQAGQRGPKLARNRLVPREPTGAYTDPQLALGKEGEVWAAFLGFDGATEHVLARRVRPMADEQPEVLSGELATCFPPRMAIPIRRAGRCPCRSSYWRWIPPDPARGSR